MGTCAPTTSRTSSCPSNSPTSTTSNFKASITSSLMPISSRKRERCSLASAHTRLFRNIAKTNWKTQSLTLLLKVQKTAKPFFQSKQTRLTSNREARKTLANLNKGFRERQKAATSPSSSNAPPSILRQTSSTRKANLSLPSKPQPLAARLTLRPLYWSTTKQSVQSSSWSLDSCFSSLAAINGRQSLA